MSKRKLGKNKPTSGERRHFDNTINNTERTAQKFLDNDEAIRVLEGKISFTPNSVAFFGESIIKAYEDLVQHPLITESDRSAITGEMPFGAASQLILVTGDYEDIEIKKDQLIQGLIQKVEAKIPSIVRSGCQRLTQTGRLELDNPMMEIFQPFTEFLLAGAQKLSEAKTTDGKKSKEFPTFRAGMLIKMLNEVEQTIAEKMLMFASEAGVFDQARFIILNRTNRFLTPEFSGAGSGGARGYVLAMDQLLSLHQQGVLNQTFGFMVESCGGKISNYMNPAPSLLNASSMEFQEKLSKIKDQTLWKNIRKREIPLSHGLSFEIQPNKQGYSPTTLCVVHMYLTEGGSKKLILPLEIRRRDGKLRFEASAADPEKWFVRPDILIAFKNKLADLILQDLDQQPDEDLLSILRKEIPESLIQQETNLQVDQQADISPTINDMETAQFPEQSEDEKAPVIAEEVPPSQPVNTDLDTDELQSGELPTAIQEDQRSQDEIDKRRFRNISSTEAMAIVQRIYQEKPLKGNAGSHRKWDRRPGLPEDTGPVGYKRLTLPIHGAKPVNQGLLINFLRSQGILREFYEILTESDKGSRTRKKPN